MYNAVSVVVFHFSWKNQSSRISVLVSTGTHTSGASFLFIWACRLASSWPVYTLASVWMAYLPSVWVYSVGCIRGEAPFLGTNVPAGLQCRYVLWLHGFTITFQLPAGSGIDRTLALCVPFACICLRLALIRIKVVIPVASCFTDSKALVHNLQLFLVFPGSYSECTQWPIEGEVLYGAHHTGKSISIRGATRESYIRRTNS